MFLMDGSLHMLGDLCAAGATLGVLYNCFAAAAVLRFFSRPKSDGHDRSSSPPVTVLKPLHGSEPGLFPRLKSLCEQDYPGRIQLVTGIQDPSDHAVHAVRLLQRLHPDVQIDLVIDNSCDGTNRKIANLANMEAAVDHDIIVLSDSDIAIDRQFIGEVTVELDRKTTGAVTCLYYGEASRSPWGRLSALGINSHFLPNVVVALTFGAARPCFGSAIALRREVLHRIGGFRSFCDELADDYAMGQAIRSLGLNVVIPHWAVGHVCSESSIHAFWDHQIRVHRTVRSLDPVGYLGLMFMHPLTFSVLAGVLGANRPVLLITSAMVSRIILTATVESSLHLRTRERWLIALHDMISFAVFVVSFFGARIEWRGQSYRILNDGTLEDSD
jgi:ceramide glucosyltransferase